MRCTLLTTILLAALTHVGIAESDLAPASLETQVASPSSAWANAGDFQPPFLRDTRLGARPTPGNLCSPAHGYDHYGLPSKHYGPWYRPAAFAEETNPRCRPRIFAPRGYGWANRLDCLQMDYHPYVVKQLPASHGPSYYQRQPPEPCHCGLQAKGARRGALTR
ncbi:MAG: hypothetical protein ACK5Q5_19345 [Planctomycetaceae bacterium]